MDTSQTPKKSNTSPFTPVQKSKNQVVKTLFFNFNLKISTKTIVLFQNFIIYNDQTQIVV